MMKIDKSRIEKLVISARSGDRSSWTELFETAYKGMHFTAMDFMKNPDDAQDAEQEAYIKIYNSIGSLEDPGKFLTWTRQITANTCKNLLKKHNVLTFSDVEGESGLADNDLSLEIEDLNIDFKPEAQVDMKETTRLIRGMMQELSDDQRLALDMFYGSELSIKEIAIAMECTENTVKSRLKYGRDAMEEKIEALRKKGTKLYLIPAALLIHLALKNEMESYAAEGCGLLLEKVLSYISENNPVHNAEANIGKKAADIKGVTAENKTATILKVGTAAGKGASVKIVMLLCAAVVGAVGIMGVVRMSKKNSTDLSSSVYEQISEQNTEVINTTESESEEVTSTDAEETTVQTDGKNNNDENTTLESEKTKPITYDTYIILFSNFEKYKETYFRLCAKYGEKTAIGGTGAEFLDPINGISEAEVALYKDLNSINNENIKEFYGRKLHVKGFFLEDWESEVHEKDGFYWYSPNGLHRFEITEVLEE